MSILYIARANPSMGLGHYYRGLSLKQHAALLYPHTTFSLWCDLALPSVDFPNTPIPSLPHHDWTIFDGPHSLSSFPLPFPTRFVVLNPHDHTSCALFWPQNDPSTVILRPSLLSHPAITNDRQLIWGGSYDPLNLLSYRLSLPPGPHLPQPLANGQLTEAHIASCSSACISFGMVAWELAYHRKPIYAFSLDAEHLHGALRLQAMGLLLAYPAVGLPPPHHAQRFLSQPFTLSSANRPDGLGAQRLLEKLI